MDWLFLIFWNFVLLIYKYDSILYDEVVGLGINYILKFWAWLRPFSFLSIQIFLVLQTSLGQSMRLRNNFNKWKKYDVCNSLFAKAQNSLNNLFCWSLFIFILNSTNNNNMTGGISLSHQN